MEEETNNQPLTAREVAAANPELDQLRQIAFGENYLDDIDAGTGTARFYSGFGMQPDYLNTAAATEQAVADAVAAEAEAAAAPVIETEGEDQVTGDLGLDTTFQDAGATDVPGTIGTLGNLTTPTKIDQLDYTDAPVIVPALDLSGTSEELIDQGVIETPQEFYERTYRTSTGESSAPEGIGPELTIDYDSLDQEEKNLIDQQYGTAYGLSPAVEPAPTLRDVPLLGVQAAFAAKDAYDRATAPSLSETIDFDTYADPGIDAEENQLTVGTNLQTTDTLDITEDPIPEIEPYADPDEITEGLTFQTPAEQIYEADVEAGLATESIFDEPALTPAPAPAPAPAPVYYDSGNGDSGGGGGSSSSSTAGDAPGYSGPSPFKEGGFVKKHAKR